MNICYTAWHLVTQTLAPTIPGLQCLKRCIQYLASHPCNPSFILIIIIMYQISSELHVMGIKWMTT